LAAFSFADGSIDSGWSVLKWKKHMQLFTAWTLAPGWQLQHDSKIGELSTLSEA
jgi:hypothetical protein